MNKIVCLCYFTLTQIWMVAAYVHPGLFPASMVVLFFGLTIYAVLEAGK